MLYFRQPLHTEIGRPISTQLKPPRHVVIEVADYPVSVGFSVSRRLSM